MSKIKKFFATIWAAIVAWFGPVKDSIRDHLNLAELVRIVVTALMAGGGLAAVLDTLSSNLSSILILPAGESAWIPVIGTVLVAVADMLRRLNHNVKPAQATPPAQAAQAKPAEEPKLINGPQ